MWKSQAYRGRDLSSRVEHPAVSCACHTARVSRQAEMHRQGLQRPMGFAYLRKGTPNENEREREGKKRHKAKKERGRSSHVTLARSSSTEFSRPNLTYPRWDLSIGFTCHGLCRYLPQYLCLSTRNPRTAISHSREPTSLRPPPTRTSHVSQAFPCDESVSFSR